MAVIVTSRVVSSAVAEMLREAIGDELWKDVEITAEGDNPASESPTRRDAQLCRRLAKSLLTGPARGPAVGVMTRARRDPMVPSRRIW